MQADTGGTFHTEAGIKQRFKKEAETADKNNLQDKNIQGLSADERERVSA